MTHNVKPSRMKYRLQFGQYQKGTKRNPNTDVYVSEFKPSLTVWGAEWNISQSRALTLAGLGITDAVEFAIRHNPKVTTEMKLKCKDTVYNIHSIAYDDTGSPKDFDIITCRKVDKHG